MSAACPRDLEAAACLQTFGTDVLAAAARGEVDLNKLAVDELAARGCDSSGMWVGFNRAAELAKAQVRAGVDEASEALCDALDTLVTASRFMLPLAEAYTKSWPEYEQRQFDAGLDASYLAVAAFGETEWGGWQMDPERLARAQAGAS